MVQKSERKDHVLLYKSSITSFHQYTQKLNINAHTLLYPLASTKMMMKPTSVNTRVVTISPLWNYNMKEIHISIT